jgi:hypothetical protein
VAAQLTASQEELSSISKLVSTLFKDACNRSSARVRDHIVQS